MRSVGPRQIFGETTYVEAPALWRTGSARKVSFHLDILPKIALHNKSISGAVGDYAGPRAYHKHESGWPCAYFPMPAGVRVNMLIEHAWFKVLLLSCHRPVFAWHPVSTKRNYLQKRTSSGDALCHYLRRAAKQVDHRV